MTLDHGAPTAEEIDRAVSFVHLTRFVGSRRARLLTLLRSPVQLWATLRLLMRLPVVAVETPIREPRPAAFYSPFSGSATRRWAGRVGCALRLPQLRLGQAVLSLPATVEEYLGGRHRQAVRTNCTRARELGLYVRDVPGEGVGPRLIVEIMAGNGERCGDHLASHERLGTCAITPGLRTLAVYDAAGDVVGAAAYYRAGRYARLEAIKCVRSEQGSLGRYLVHTTLIETLVAEGAELLFADSGISVTTGLHYLHRRLGYEVVNLRIRTARPARRRRPVHVAPRLISQPGPSRAQGRHRKVA